MNLRRQPRTLKWRGGAGSSLLETAMWFPLLLLLLYGLVEFGRVSYTYFALQKALYSVARYAGSTPGINLCDEADSNLQAAKNLALRGTPDESVEPLIQGLEPEMIEVRIERYNSDTGELEQCECSESGCDAAAGGIAPDYLVVSIPDGFAFQLTIPAFPIDPILLRPVVRVPHGGI